MVSSTKNCTIERIPTSEVKREADREALADSFVNISRAKVGANILIGLIWVVSLGAYTIVAAVLS